VIDVVPEEDPYQGREQALVKHEVLRRYLQRLAFKVGGFQPGTTLNYIDGFSGPWDSAKRDHRDSSPVIAMHELATARNTLAARSSRKAPMKVRAMFVESNRAAFERLEVVCARAPIEAIPFLGEFEEHISEAVDFARHGPHPFAFIFIDPTGWTGYALQRIKPLLQVRPSEVLINFMAKDILRFIDDKTSSTMKSFEELFGQDTESYRKQWRGLEGIDREDEIVRAYCRRIRDEGAFEHCVSTIIANPHADRTHYRLVFATRRLKGLITFREIERSVTPVQQEVRAQAKQRKRHQRIPQGDLFAASEMDTDYFRRLVARYRRGARSELEASLASIGSEASYDALIASALGWPMTSEAQVKEWLKELVRAGRVELTGLGAHRVPKIGAGHRVRRIR